jgi:hypothetical protein
VELRAAAIERREEALRLRELELEQRAVELAELARQLDEVGRSLDAGVERRPVREDEHVALVTDDGYRLVVRLGPPPAAGDDVELEDGSYRCVRTARSPYPGDDRACAVLERLLPVE